MATLVVYHLAPFSEYGFMFHWQAQVSHVYPRGMCTVWPPCFYASWHSILIGWKFQCLNFHWLKFQYLEEQPGHFVTLDGKVMGKHRGKIFNLYPFLKDEVFYWLDCVFVSSYVSVCVMCRPSFFHHWPAGKAGRDGKRLVCSWQGPTEQHHHSGMFVSFLVWQSGNETEWQLTPYMYVGWRCLSSCPLLSLLHHLPPSLDRRGASQPTGPGETVWVPHALQTSEATQWVDHLTV